LILIRAFSFLGCIYPTLQPVVAARSKFTALLNFYPPLPNPPLQPKNAGVEGDSMANPG